MSFDGVLSYKNFINILVVNANVMDLVCRSRAFIQGREDIITGCEYKIRISIKQFSLLLWDIYQLGILNNGIIIVDWFR